MIHSDKIIIIDDDLSYREVLARSLSRLNFQPQHFSKPEDAKHAIACNRPCIILLDLKLENDSGLVWIKSFKVVNPECYIILLTGYASISTAVEAIKLGADDYLSKPITSRELVNHLQNKELTNKKPINDKPMSVGRLEWEHIQKVLLTNKGNISASARALSMHRRTLQRKLAKKPIRD